MLHFGSATLLKHANACANMALGLLVNNQAIVAAMFDRYWDPPCRAFGSSFVQEDKSISSYLPFVQPAAKADSEPLAPDAAKSIKVRNPGGSRRLTPIPNLSHEDGGDLDQVSGICGASCAVGFDVRTAQFLVPPCYFQRPTRLKLDTGQAK